MKFETLLYEESDDGVAVITLNRPDRLNAFNRQMGNEFIQLWTHIRESETVRAVVLQAEGRAFSTGADVKVGGWRKSGTKSGPFDQDDPGPSLGPKQNRVWKPVVTAVNGMCCGGGFYWVNESDIIICAEDAQFFDSHVNIGKVSAVEPIGLMGRVPLGHITRMVLMGLDERIGARTALQIGLVTEVVPAADLRRRAREIAAAMAKKPPTAIQGTVRALWEALDMPHNVAVANALKYAQLGNVVGAEELARHPLEKRPWVER